MRSLFGTSISRDWLVWGWVLCGATVVLAALAELVPTFDVHRDPDWALLGMVAGRVVLALVAVSLVVLVVAVVRGELGDLLGYLDARSVARLRAAARSARRTATAGSGGAGEEDPLAAAGPPTRTRASRTTPAPRPGCAAPLDVALDVPSLRSLDLPVMPKVRLVAHVDVASTSLPSVRSAVEDVLARHAELDPPPLPPLPPLGVPSALLRRLDSVWQAVEAPAGGVRR